MSSSPCCDSEFFIKTLSEYKQKRDKEVPKRDDDDSVKVENRDVVRVLMRVTMKIVNNLDEFLRESDDENHIRFLH